MIEIKRISLNDAERVCRVWHYTKTCATGGRYCIGAWENKIFVGVIVFGHGACSNLGHSENFKSSEVCELVRVALSGKQKTTSQILSKAIKFFKKNNPNIRAIYSFADYNQDHVGTIYQATNWIYLGISKPSPTWIDINGKSLHNRTYDHKKHKGYKKIMQKHKYKYIYATNKKDRKRLLKLHKPYPKNAKG